MSVPTPAELDRLLSDFIRSSAENHVLPSDALSPELAGMRFFDDPIWGCAPADDPLFDDLKKREAIGPWFRTPREWLPEAKSVLSVFLPYSDEVKSCEDLNDPEPSFGWLHARIEGNLLVIRTGEFLEELFSGCGFRTVMPTHTKDFFSVWEPGSSERMTDPTAGYTSLWSERHIAYVCGLGTFGLSGGLITRKGICGRFVSIVTDAELPVTPRDYTGIYDYCTRCGLCAKHCPAGAITLEHGKNHSPCGARLNETKARYAPRFGCGKCQLGVPCTSGIPGRK